MTTTSPTKEDDHHHNPPPVFYSRSLFRHSPTFTRWALLSAHTIHTTLRQLPGFGGQKIWHHGNHPIHWVRVVGVLVALDTFDIRHGLVIDDGSGETLDAVIWRNRAVTPPSIDGVQLGCVVRVGGEVSEFRGVKQIEVKYIKVLKDTNEEVKALGALRTFEREVLARPWVIAEEVLERERRKAAKRKKKAEEEWKKKAVGVAGVAGVEKAVSAFRGRRRSPGRSYLAVIPPFQEQKGGAPVPEMSPPVLPTTTAPKFIGHRRAPRLPEVPPTAPIPDAASEYIGRKRPKPPEPIPTPTPAPEAKSKFIGHRRTQSLTVPPPPTPLHTVLKRSASSVETLSVSPALVAKAAEPSSSFRGHKRVKLLSDEAPVPMVPAASQSSSRGGAGHRRSNKPLKPLFSPPQSFTVVAKPDEYCGRKLPAKASPPPPVRSPPPPPQPPTAPVSRGKQRTTDLPLSQVPQELLDSICLSSPSVSSNASTTSTTSSSPDPPTPKRRRLSPITITETSEPPPPPRRGRSTGTSEEAQQPKARFLGRRRVGELSTELLPPGTQPCTSARDLNRALAEERRKEKEREVVAVEPTTTYRGSRRMTRAVTSSQEAKRRRKTQKQEVAAAMGKRKTRSSQEEDTQTSTSTSTPARSKRRTRSSQDDPPLPLPQSSSFRGKRRAATLVNIKKPKPKPTTPASGFIGKRRKTNHEKEKRGEEEAEEDEHRLLAAMAAMASPYVPSPTPTQGVGMEEVEFSDYVPSPVPPPPPPPVSGFVGKRRK